MIGKLGFSLLGQKGTKVKQGSLDLMGILPKEWQKFYYYKGSFTTPPCTEGVRWRT